MVCFLHFLQHHKLHDVGCIEHKCGGTYYIYYVRALQHFVIKTVNLPILFFFLELDAILYSVR